MADMFDLEALVHLEQTFAYTLYIVLVGYVYADSDYILVFMILGTKTGLPMVASTA